jgi:hypoxanthine phosphoribosyltransferase
MADVEKTYMSWDKFDSDITEFIKYLETYEFDKDSVIVGLKRGGFPAAAALSNKMDIPVSVVAFQTRDGDDVVPQFLEPESIKSAKKIIIPDDIYDSGLTVETLVKELQSQFGKSLDDMAGLFHYGSDKLPSTELKFYRVLDSNEGKWVCFPWE